jgi:thioredoxin-related protein
MRTSVFWVCALCGLAVLVLLPASSISGGNEMSLADSLPPERPTSEKLDWRADYGKARTEAQETKRPLFLILRSSNCVWCNKLEQEIGSDAALGKVLTQDFVAVRLYAEPEATLFERLRIEAYPTIILADHDGKIRHRSVGFQTADQLRKMIAEVRGGVMPSAE